MSMKRMVTIIWIILTTFSTLMVGKIAFFGY
jgi:hypothetical protein